MPDLRVDYCFSLHFFIELKTKPDSLVSIEAEMKEDIP